MMLGCVALAMLPDVDVVSNVSVACDGLLLGHRGITHSPMFAVLVGLAMGFWWFATPVSLPVAPHPGYVIPGGIYRTLFRSKETGP
jgi:membrane-bound metal-dependent hydrolase YbcI (DUF457 family)